MCFVHSPRHNLVMQAERAPCISISTSRTSNMRAPDQAVDWPDFGQFLTLPYYCTSLRIKPTATSVCRCCSHENAGLAGLPKSRERGRGERAGISHTELVSPHHRSLLETRPFLLPPTAHVDSVTKELMAWAGWLNSACSTSRLRQLAYQSISSMQVLRTL
jgi:hypothetical protein